MAETTYPGDSNAFRDQWPMLAGGDGIFGDKLGDALTVTASGAAPTVTVSPGAAGVSITRVAGFAHVLDAPVTLDLSLVGTQPTGTQKRVDLIVVRYTWADALNVAAKVAIKAGAPTASTTPLATAAPVPTQLRGSVWEVPVRAVSRPAGGVVTAGEDRREWNGNDVRFISSASQLDAAPVGALRYLPDGVAWHRRLVGTTPAWIASVPSLTGQFSGVTSSAGDIIFTQAFGRTPAAVLITPVGSDAHGGFLPAASVPFIRVLNSNGFVVRFARGDNGFPLTGNLVTFYYHVIF